MEGLEASFRGTASRAQGHESLGSTPVPHPQPHSPTPTHSLSSLHPRASLLRLWLPHADLSLSGTALSGSGWPRVGVGVVRS